MLFRIKESSTFIYLIKICRVTSIYSHWVRCWVFNGETYYHEGPPSLGDIKR